MNLKESRRTSSALEVLGAFGLLLVLPLLYSSHSLQKGQAIKQFFAYSISQSLSLRPQAILETRLPCDPPRIWVEEPPIFHELAAWGLRLVPNTPTLLPLMAFLLLAIGIFRIQHQLIQIPQPSKTDLADGKFIGARETLPFRAGWVPDGQRAGVQSPSPTFSHPGLQAGEFTQPKSQKKPGRTLLLLTILATCCPIFLRYSIQHLPDPLSAAFLCLGAAFLVNSSSSKPRWGQVLPWIFFFIAITVKALAAFAVAPILFWYFFIRGREDPLSLGNFRHTRPYLNFGFSLFFLSLTFIFWLFALYKLNIPNPFFVQKTQKWLENRHSGSLSLLLDFHFYFRAFTWIAIKGVGLILIGPAVYSLVKIWRSKRLSGTEGLLFFWSTGIIPFWFIVRQANVIHDYYTFPFAAPLAILGAGQLLQLKPKWIISILGSIHLILGSLSLIGMRTIPLQEGRDRPLYCEMENWDFKDSVK